MIDRLYIVVREDLHPGAQLAQGLHAFRDFVEAHGDVELTWYRTSNTIVALSVPDEEALLQLREKLERRRLKYALFREPDFDDEATALAIEPKGKGACRGLRLALA